MKILFKKDNGLLVAWDVREDQLSSVINIAGACRLLGLNYETVKSRINRGWHPLLALSTSEE
ncbi:hypothetical protein [Pantoea ananatis]|uniref:hypothetical protein n=1 Tax=Pantoea ananas TaxID=553 RepID=UPI001B318882|nr:hypothetical protein [Pantoea ananatis]